MLDRLRLQSLFELRIPRLRLAKVVGVCQKKKRISVHHFKLEQKFEVDRDV
jgi:hypothetical protein